MTEAQLNAAIALFRSETEDLFKALTRQIYFKDGISPYATTAEVLSTIPTNDRIPYITLVNVAGVDYWFTDANTLVPYVGSISVANGVITLAKMADIATASFIGRKTAETGSPEVLSVADVKTLLGITDVVSQLGDKVEKVSGYALVPVELIELIHENLPDDNKVDVTAAHSLVADTEIEKLESLLPPFQILLPASGSVAGRLSGSTVPSGWTITNSGAYNLLVTHTLTGRKLASVNVFEIDGANERLCVPFQTAFSGVLCNGLTVLIEGLNPSALALRIELIFD